mgnify:CR=1 FL=1
MKKLLALLMIWLLLPVAGAEEAYTMQEGSLILMDGAGRKCQPIAMKPDFPEALLADADISGAIQLNLPETLLPYVSDELTGGETLVELYCTTELIAMHTVDAADGDVLRVAYRTNLGNYVIRKVIGTPFSFDRYHGGAASILLCIDEITYCMTCENGYLTLREVWNGAGGIGIKRHALYDLQACVESAGGNAGFRYGNHPYSDVTDLPFADFPTTYEEAMQHLDRMNWAVVNNPNPADRLYLRGKASKEGRNLGKFYNRTPVYVDEIRGEWAHVTIGRDLSGWMMTKYLAFGADMDKVKCSFPQLSLIEKYQENVADELAYDYYVFDAPNMSATKTLWNWGEECYLIGVIDDFYMIMDTDENVRYIPQDWLWAGNG